MSNNFGSRSSGFYGGNVTICGGGAGTVTVVSATGCDGICITGSPYYTSGVLLVCNTKPYNGEAVVVLGGGTNSTVRCGVSNTASGYGSVSLGGTSNTSSGNYSVIAGGNQNVANGCNTFIGNSTFGGNTASGYASFIGNGSLNQTSNVGYAQFIGNGNSNFACCYYSSVLNGNNNISCNNYASVLGGCGNTVSGAFSGAFGCNINGTSACTFYTNNHCACGSFFTSSIASGCAVCVSGASGQLVGYSPTSLYYGSFFDTTTQNNGGGTTANQVVIGSTQVSNGFTLNANNSISVINSGVYYFSTNLQLAFTGGASNYNVTAWYTKNDVIVPNSAFTFTTTGAQNDQTLATITDIISLNAGDFIKFYWWSQATGMKIITTPSGSNPSRPLSPSVNVNIFNVG